MRAFSMAASAVALLTVSAYAQSQFPSGNPAQPRGATQSYSPAPVQRVPAPNPLKQEDVSKIEGTAVLGSDGKKVGDVSTLLMKPDDKMIDRLVVRTGGLLGVGAHHVAMPIDAFSWDADAGAFKISKTADELKSMAEWTPPSSETSATGSSSPPQGSTPPSRSGQ